MIKIQKHTGVYYRESSSRKHQGKHDRCFYITFKNNAKQVYEKVGWLSEGYSAQMASNIRAERIRSIRHGDEIALRKREITFGDAWDKYNEWLDAGKKHPANDRIRYNKHLKSRLAHKHLSQITPIDLEKIKTELTQDGLAPATIKHVLVVVRQVINKAILWDLWKGENPVKRVGLPRLNNRRERFLSPEEATSLLHELQEINQQLYEITLISLYTGMRAGEIFSLKWGNLDFVNGIINISDSKSGDPRNSYMTAKVREAFKSMPSGQPEEFVFKDRNGTAFKEIGSSFKTAVKRLGLNEGITDRRQKVCFHTLRHTFASWLALRGNSLLTIKELLGHKTLAMTIRYSHLIPDHKKMAIKGIEETMNQPEQPEKRTRKKASP
jgi:integrase